MSKKQEYRVNFKVTKEYEVRIAAEKPEGMSDEEFAKTLEDEAYRKYGDNEYIEYVVSYGPSKIWIQEIGYVVPFADISETQKITIITPLEDDYNMKNKIIDKYEELSGNFFSTLTSEQKESVIRVVDRQGIDKLVAIYHPTTFTPYVSLAFEHIFIGVERDGYAHS